MKTSFFSKEKQPHAFDPALDEVAGANAVSLSPPLSGIHFVDREAGETKSPASLSIQKKSLSPARHTAGDFKLDDEMSRRINRERAGGQSLECAVSQQMSHATGHDFSNVRVHSSAESHRLNQSLHAKAFTTGSDIFFKQGAYAPGSSKGRGLISHELSHVVQQRSGRVPALGNGMTVKSGESALEREAHINAKQATQGGPSGEGVLQQYSNLSSGKGPIQRYVEKTDTDGDPWRVSESGKSALWVEQDEGGQTLFATPNLIKQANGDLAKAGKNGSFVRLKATSSPLKAGLLDHVSADVRAIEPKLVTLGADPGGKKLENINKSLRADDDGTTSKEFAMWADCGRSSRMVMGTDDADLRPKAQVKIGGKNMETTNRAGNPASFTFIYRLAMPEFMKVKANRSYLQKGIHFDEKFSGISWSEWKIKTREVMKTPTDDDDAKKMYWALGKAGRRAFDAQTGMNTGANPEIGGAYTMATEYDMPGFAEQGARTWNFHWAGVVMKDGENNVTLENYAVSYGSDPDPVKNAALQQKAYDEVNRAWVFQMYGTKKKGQTFQEEHLKSGTHGNRGTSFAVKV